MMHHDDSHSSANLPSFGCSLRAKGLLILLALTLLPAPLLAGRKTPKAEAVRGEMRKYEGKYHILYTDLPREDVLEALLRITAMAECYHRRTKGFSGKITKKFPFYLYSNREDYQTAIVQATGKPGMARSAGLYDGRSLRATADFSRYPKHVVWRIVQHEGFHQFVHVVISNRGRLPIWLNEGLAEYFGKAVWTGDELISGVIQDGREYGKTFKSNGRLGGDLGQLQRLLKAGSLKPWKDMIGISSRQWNSEMDGKNYLQAWSMVYFLIKAHNGKYAKRFSKYVDLCAKGAGASSAFAKCFGRNLSKLETEYKKWWLNMKVNPSEIVYDRIVVETLMAYLARYQVKNPKAKFESVEAFFKAAAEGTLTIDSKKTPLYWLPADLKDKALKSIGDPKAWALIYKGTKPMLTYTREDGQVIEATYGGGSKRKLPNIKIKIYKPKVDKTKKKTPTPNSAPAA